MLIMDVLASLIAALGWSGSLVLVLLLYTQGPAFSPMLRRYLRLKLLAWTVLVLFEAGAYMADGSPESILSSTRQVVFRTITTLASWLLVYDLLRPRVVTTEPVPEALIEIDPDGIVTAWNGIAEDMFGWTPEEMLTGNVELAERIIPPQYREAHRQGLVHYRETGEAPLLDKKVTLPAVTKDGRTVIIDVRLTKHLGDRGTRFLARISPAQVVP
jgi:PAS domain S-box-containing protein